MSSKRRNKKRKMMEKRKIGETMTENTISMEEKQSHLETVTPVVLAVESQPEKPLAPENSVSTKKEVEKNLYLQYNNLEFSDRLMFEAAINDYCKNTGSSAEHIEAVNLYVKPEEGRAYYVVNHDGERAGFIDL